jgi:tRNA modification GTPase
MSTIVALSTPRGPGALGVVRLSGPLALVIIKALADNAHDFQPRTATLVKLRDPETKEILDEVLATFFEGPHSLTGEDVVEISCHGSPSVVRQLIDVSLSLGATLAGPGEFSLRALLNGKMNLAEAEAVRDLIAAQTETAARQAARQATGELSVELTPLKGKLLDVIVVLESAVEFVEDDLPATEIEKVVETIKTVRQGVDRLANSYRSGHLLRDGIQVAITGKPNVGKSSLFNRLVERDRAIVAALPGTTRDTLSETIDIGGVPVVLTDTAGLRDTVDDIESLGIERAHRALNEADIVLDVLDGSLSGGQLNRNGQHPTVSGKKLTVINKVDLIEDRSEVATRLPTGVLVSASTGEGLRELRTAILQMLGGGAFESGSLLITNARHHELLRQTSTELTSALDALGSALSEEMVLVPLHNALRFLGEITGETTTEDILSQIFSTFCIGK